MPLQSTSEAKKWGENDGVIAAAIAMRKEKNIMVVKELAVEDIKHHTWDLNNHP